MANKTLDVTFDFGFSAVNEDELESIKILEKKAKDTEFIAADTQDKLQRMYSMVLPLIDNLMQDPDKSYIHWPNRKEKLHLFKSKLLEILEEG
jgi:hypothetical protein